MLISISDLIKRTISLYKKNFLIILKYLILSAIPGILGAAATLGLMKLITTTGSYDKSIIYFGIPVTLVLFIVLFVLSIWFNFAFIRAINELYTNSQVEKIKDNLNNSKHVILSGLWTSIVSSFYSGWPMFVFMVALFGRVYYTDYLHPAIAIILNIILPLLAVYAVIHLTYFAIKLVFSVFITVLENKKSTEALRISRERTKNIWWPIALRIVAPLLLIYVILIIIDSVLMAIGNLTGDIGKIIMVNLDMIINYLAIPTSLIIGVILYNETKKPQVVENMPPVN